MFSRSLLCALALSSAVLAHNGVIAVSTPVRGITVDGDLSDWPSDLPVYPIANVSWGDEPTGPDDFLAQFRVAHDSTAGFLYLAIEVRDESIILDPMQEGKSRNWDTQDGVEVYFSTDHTGGYPPAQHLVRGSVMEGSADQDLLARGVASREGDLHRYEWRLPITDRATTTFSLDLAVQDRDQDGSFSWIAWGPGTEKYGQIERTGDLLIAADALVLGRVRGRLTRVTDDRGVGGTSVQIVSRRDSTLRLTLQSGPRGWFEASLPADSYDVMATARRAPAGTVSVDVTADQTTQVDLRLRPASGRRMTTGRGRSVGASSGTHKNRWHWFGVSDGLQRSEVVALAQDADGYLWIGSREGVSRFDGESFVHFSSPDGFPADRVYDLLPADGALWIAAESGLYHLEGASITHYDRSDGLPVDRVTAVDQDASGGLWLGTNRGLCQFARGYFTCFGPDEGIPDTEVRSIFVDAEGHPSVATTAGIYRREDGRFHKIFQHSSGTLGYSTLTVDEAGRYWAGLGSRLFQFDSDGQNVVALETAGSVRALILDRRGVPWAGAGGDPTPFGGSVPRLVTVRSGKLVQIEGLPQSQILALTETADGNLWVGGSGFIARRDPSAAAITTAEGLPDDRVSALLEDASGVVWIGTPSGLAYIEEGRPVLMPLDPARAAPLAVTSIDQDETGRLWVGTREGLFVGDSNGFSLFTGGTLDGNLVILAVKAQGETVWIGVNERLYRIGAEVEEFDVASGLQSSVINVLQVDSDHRIWIGTLTGLDVYEHGRFTRIDARFVAPITDLTTQGNRLWIGTQAGLYHRVDGDLQKITTGDGLVHNTISSLHADDAGRVWIGTAGGLSIIRNGIVQSWNAQDGIGAVNSTLVDRRGQIWIGTRDQGVIRRTIDPSTPAVFVDAAVTTHRISTPDRVEMTTGQDLLALEVRGVSLKTRPGGLRYRHRLVGHSDWQVTSSRRIEYSDLGAGEYLFEVQAVDRDLALTPEPARTLIVVAHPYGQIALWSFLGLACVGLMFQAVQIVRRNRLLTAAQGRLEASLKAELAARQEAEALRHQAESANQAKSAFLANMSHEIRTPMNAILGFAEILRGLNTDPAQSQYLNSIQSSGRSLLGLINDILDISKVEAGKLHLEYAAMDPSVIFHDMAAIFAQKTSQKGIAFIVDLDAALPRALMLDETRLRQILINLLGNAIKFTEQGHVRLTVKVEHAQPEHVDLLIAVEDTGIGIPKDQLDRIFDAFEQTEGQSFNKFGGTGLGLSITKKLVEMMAGDIWADSTVNEGSTFYVRLRSVDVAAVEDLAVKEDLNVEGLVFDPVSLLVVDDVETNRQLVSAFLQPHGVTPMEASDGKEGLQQARRLKPVLILTDTRMPELDGVEMARQLRASADTRDIKIIALTASVMKQEEAETIHLFDGFLRKPVTKNALIGELCRFLPYQRQAVTAPAPSEPEEDWSPESLAPADRQRLPALIQHIERGLWDEWEQLRSAMSITDIEDFAARVEDLGSQFAFPPLTWWGTRLQEQASLFQLDVLPKTLDQFPALLDEIRSLSAPA